MLYWFADRLSELWGPLRLFSSHLVLMSFGSLLAGFFTWWLLPKFWDRLPHDRGKAIAADGGAKSKNKPTGAGLVFTLVILAVALLFVPFQNWEYGTVAALYASMVFGYLDDRSSGAWGEWRKGLLDLLASLAAATCIYLAQGGHVWVPFAKGLYLMPAWSFIPCATMVLLVSINATNCSDGVDGLAGSLAIEALLSLIVLLYLVVGYAPVASYLLIPFKPDAARWAVFALTATGSVAGYLWYNAEPSKVLMGDAGSRFLGMLIGVLVLVSGNLWLLLMVAPMIILNGATGLVKLTTLRFFRVLGFDVRITSKIPDERERRKQFVLIRALHKVRLPLHDFFRKKERSEKSWSNAMVLMRFVLIQGFLIPILFVIMIKLR
ncbi:MAG: phospho-N-acetylmuramoyl-pentapeptide-transferase [Kiritimatiellae bacterium]|nr:phospho-N-acetylmuramoyl-pentapeptide-transferase [Kiritimatiellia bacterium]